MIEKCNVVRIHLSTGRGEGVVDRKRLIDLPFASERCSIILNKKVGTVKNVQ